MRGIGIMIDIGYNTAIALWGAGLLGGAAGMLGALLILQKRTLVSDSLSHAALPGVGAGFLLAYGLGADSDSIPYFLMAGAFASAALALLSIHLAARHTRLTQDAAIAGTLVFYYGLGVVLLSVIQRLPMATPAGIGSVLLGQIASLSVSEAQMITALSLLSLLVIVSLQKEWRLHCFDPVFSRSIGRPAARLDFLLNILVLLVVATGIKTAGVILTLALLITPGATARLWTQDFFSYVLLSGAVGAICALCAAAASARLPDTPTGALIVLSLCAAFFLSFGARSVIDAAARRAA